MSLSVLSARVLRPAALLLAALSLNACNKQEPKTPPAPKTPDSTATSSDAEVLPGMAASVKNPSLQPILACVDAANDEGWQSEELSNATST